MGLFTKQGLERFLVTAATIVPHRVAAAHGPVFSAYEAFVREGVEEPTTAAVAERAKVNKATVSRTLRSPVFSAQRLRLIELMASLKAKKPPAPLESQPSR